MAGLLATLAAALGGLQLLDRRLRNSVSGGREQAQGARWAGGRDLRDLRAASGERRGRLVLGRHRGELLATVGQTSVLVVGPTRSSFKTTGFTIPAVLEWQGPVVATSVKSDLVRTTLRRRSQMGEAMVFDPTGATRLGNVKATPLSGCEEWQGAMRIAHTLTRAAKSSRDGLQDSAFWHAAAEKLIAPILYAAASSGATTGEVIAWLEGGREAGKVVEEKVKEAGSQEALSALRANWRRDSRQLSSIYTTAETVLRAFADPQVLEQTSRADYRPEVLLDGGMNTLYLCAPAQEQERLASVFATMLSEIVREVSIRAAATGEAIDPPLLIVLDEAANTAPLPDLDAVAASGAGEGIQLVTVLQDYAQAEARWGASARTIFNNHPAKVFAGGIGDPQTQSYISGVIGEGEYRDLRETVARDGGGSETEGTNLRALAPAHVVREARPGTGLLIYGHRPAARISMRPWFEDPELTAMVEGETP